MTLDEIRAQNPEYDDMPDDALADALHRKFYSDMPRAEFNAKVGLATATDPRDNLGFNERFNDAVTFGLSKDAVALARTLPREIGSYFTGKPYEFMDEYGKAREGYRSQLDQYSEENPWKAGTADVLGAIGSASLFKAPAATTFGGRVLQAGKEGALAGGLTGLGESQGGVQDRAAGAAIGAGAGGTIGLAAAPVMEGLGRAAGWAARKTGLIRPPAPGVDPMARIADAGSFDIPLSRGQATGNIAQQASEEAMRHGGRGGSAASILQGFDTAQDQAVRAAAGRASQNLAGSGPRLGGDMEVGASVAAGVRGRAQALKRSGSNFYKQASELGANVGADQVEYLPQEVARRLAKEAENFAFDFPSQPAAAQALAEIESLGLIGGKAVSPATRAGQEAAPKVVSFDEVWRTAKRINSMKAASAPDAAALAKVKSAFNGWWEDAIDAKLFEGSDIALDAIKKGNKDYSQYLAMIRPQKGDDAGRIIKKMVELDVNGQEVANWLYGSSVVRPPGSAVRVATNLKKMLGETSNEWLAVRQGAWLRLADETAGPQKMSTSILEFIEGSGRPLAEKLYSPEELRRMAGFARVLKTLVPDPKATNPSKSGYSVARYLEGAARTIAGLLGFTAGGGPFTASGWALGVAAPAAVTGVKSVSRNVAARRAVNPNLTVPLFKGRSVGRLTRNAAVPLVINSDSPEQGMPAR
jgi:hypothetical protein